VFAAFVACDGVVVWRFGCGALGEVWVIGREDVPSALGRQL
jgi:hypothetical protein